MKSKIVFFDDYWLDVKRNVHKRWGTPSLLSSYGDSVFRNGIYPSIQWCPETGTYRLWYEVMPDIKNDALRYLAVAESRDARRWESFHGKKETKEGVTAEYPHVVYDGNGGLHGTAVFRDEQEKDASRRYKAMGMTRTYAGGKRPATLPVRLSTSPDGIHWKEEHTVHPYTSDTLNSLFYNPSSELYTLIFRAAYVDRRIFMSTSRDLKTWSPARLIVHPDAEYGADNIQLYGMWGGWDEGIFLGFNMNYYVDMDESNFSTMKGYMDSELMYSYDGEYWMHTTRQPVIPRNLPGEFGHSQLVITGMTASENNDSYIIVATGARFSHSTSDVYEKLMKEYNTPAHKFFFYTIRKDGFAGLENSTSGGLIITKPVELLEPDLTLNFSAPFGKIRCAILNPDGEAFPGFSFQDALPFSEDSTAGVPTWKEKELRELTGQRIRIAIEISSGVLYSINAVMRPSIRTAQKSFSDPVQVQAERSESNQT